MCYRNTDTYACVCVPTYMFVFICISVYKVRNSDYKNGSVNKNLILTHMHTEKESEDGCMDAYLKQDKTKKLFYL